MLKDAEGCCRTIKNPLSQAATAFKPAVWKRGISKRGNLRRPIYHVLNLESQIKLIFNTVQSYNFDINEFNLTYEAQNMANCPIWNRPVSKWEV